MIRATKDRADPSLTGFTKAETDQAAQDASWKAFTQRGNTKFELGRFDEARIAYEAALSVADQLIKIACEDGAHITDACPRFIVSAMNAARNVQAAGSFDIMESYLENAAMRLITIAKTTPNPLMRLACARNMPVLLSGYRVALQETGRAQSRYKQLFDLAASGALASNQSSAAAH